jgi:hypothetical protein
MRNPIRIIRTNGRFARFHPYGMRTYSVRIRRYPYLGVAELREAARVGPLLPVQHWALFRRLCRRWIETDRQGQVAARAMRMYQFSLYLANENLESDLSA